MALFSDSFLRDLADQTSIVEMVGRYVQLKRKGSDYWGCCPFHNEKSASFKVNELRKAYKCFGCGEGGDAYKFLMKLEGLGFVEAVKELAEAAGVPMPVEDLSPGEAAAAAKRDRLFNANEIACRYFEQLLGRREGREGQAELERRGVDPELARRFRLGVSADAWDGLVVALRKAGIAMTDAEEAGLVLRRKSADGYYDRFRNRLIFPISTASGKVVAFGGRTLGDDDAKYINSPESPVYNKSNALYGLHQARTSIHKEDKVLVVEGYFDVLGLSRAGLGFAVAPCGTALTERQLSTLRRHTRNVVMLFDSDAAGQRAAHKALELSLTQGLWPSWLSVPDGKDPDDFVREQGAEAMRALLQQQRPLLDVYIDDKFAEAGPDRFAQEATLDEVAPLLRDLAPTPRRHYVLKVAQALGVDPRIVEERMRTAKPKRRAPIPTARPNPNAGRRPPGPDDRRAGGRPPQGSLDSDGVPWPDEEGAPLDEPDFSGYEDYPEAGKPVVPSTPTQRELLKLMVQDLPNVAAAVDDMGATSWLRSPSVELVVGRLLRTWREGRHPNAMDLLPGVDDAELISDLTGVLASDDEWYTEEILQKATQECLIRLRLEWIAYRRTKLARELSSLQRAGGAEIGLLAQLTQECVELDREKDALQSHLQGVL